MNKKAVQRLKLACEKAKIALSDAKSDELDLEALHNKLNFKCIITREIMEEQCAAIFEKCLNTVKQVINDARL